MFAKDVRKPHCKITLPPNRPATEYRDALAARLDRAADYHLHLGFHHQAERLSRQASEMRGAA